MTYGWLAVIVFVAFGIEAAMGFGCTILAVTVGVLLYPMAELLPVLVGLNLLVSLYIVIRHRDAIDGRLLWRRVVPLMVPGIPVGMAIFYVADGSLLKLSFGLFVILIAGVELIRSTGLNGSNLENKPLSTWKATALLLGAGLTHGMYASGGPLVIYFASRQPLDKRCFRSTMSALWLLLNLILVGGYIVGGNVEPGTASVIGWMLVPLIGGIVVGEWFHGKIPERIFRILVFVLLLAGGVVLTTSVLHPLPL